MKAGVSTHFPSLCAALLAAGAACAQPQGPAPTAPAAQAQRSHAARVDPLEQRVQLLSRELDLNLEQRAAVRRILQGQREAVQHIWQDPAIDPAERAPAVRLLGERTADQIRAVLNEEQRKKYNRALTDGALSTRSNVNVEGWLRTVRGQTAENPLGVPLPGR